MTSSEHSRVLVGRRVRGLEIIATERHGEREVAVISCGPSVVYVAADRVRDYLDLGVALDAVSSALIDRCAKCSAVPVEAVESGTLG